MTLEEAEKEVFNNKKNEPDSLFSDYGQTENAFGGESLFEDSKTPVRPYRFSTLTLPAIYLQSEDFCQTELMPGTAISAGEKLMKTV